MDKQGIKTVRNQIIAAAVHAGHSWTRALDDKRHRDNARLSADGFVLK